MGINERFPDGATKYPLNVLEPQTIKNKPKIAYSRDLADVDYHGLSWTIIDYHRLS